MCRHAQRTDDLAWERAPATAGISSGEVHLWRVALELDSEPDAHHMDLLCGDERLRAARIRHDRVRRTFVLARAHLRTVLAQYTGLAPGRLSFVLNAAGKPSLAPQSGTHGIRFNVTHSGQYALIAVSGQCEVGVDLERIRPRPSADGMVRRLFTDRERDRYFSLSDEERAAGFFTIWCRKEACVKASGVGVPALFRSLDVCDVAARPTRVVMDTDGGRVELEACDLNPAPGFVGAVAAAGEIHVVRRWRL